ncbi:probable E3 ubiquitin-protein ligase RHY1A [Rutidosis leptorrhynchoides]|uniref:probable E3 ubiquitin-protein ligase RHY1A n=1 Tax=Rutidosis leptorrhynchoides TaxID=125765 RepID=UPI003A9A051F
MTGASKLFHSRRIRFGARNDDSVDTQLDSPPADANSHRRTTDRRHHHRNNRLDHGSCNPNLRRNHRHRVSEHEVVQVEQGVSHPLYGSIINSEDFRSMRRRGAAENDRLPGVVLLARERLLERLRGVHVSENRQSSSSTSSIHQDDFSYGSFFETNNNLLEESVPESWQMVMPLSSMTKMLPGGLSENEINQLSVKVFNAENNESSSASRECSICLESFEDGEELINLSCKHKFHSCCLYPWVEVCGACPNCRKDIVVTTTSN